MLAELRTRSQITIPKQIVVSLGLSEGDQLDIFEKDGMVCMVPVVTYPKKYVEELKKEVKELKKNIKSGKQKVFNNIDDMISSLEKDWMELCVSYSERFKKHIL